MWQTSLMLAAAALSLAAMAFPGDVMAQAGAYPDRPVRFVAPYGPGGTVDPTARVLAGPVGEILGRPVIVENKPGAAGSIGTEYVARQPADGYTVLIHTNLVASEPWLKPNLSYNFLKDMTPIMAINETPFVLLVNPSLPVKTVKEFVEGFEVEAVPLWQWETAILDSYRVFRALCAGPGGRVSLDLGARRLTYAPHAARNDKQAVLSPSGEPR